MIMSQVVLLSSESGMSEKDAFYSVASKYSFEIRPTSFWSYAWSLCPDECCRAVKWEELFWEPVEVKKKKKKNHINCSQRGQRFTDRLLADRRWWKVEMYKPATRPTYVTWRLQVERSVKENVKAALRRHSACECRPGCRVKWLKQCSSWRTAILYQVSPACCIEPHYWLLQITPWVKLKAKWLTRCCYPRLIFLTSAEIF